MTLKILLDIFGGVALLLWGLHMVQTGFTRALGGELRSLTAKLLKSRFHAVIFGCVITLALQSSTAIGLILGSFSANGVVELPIALATMMGANIGSAFTVQLLSFDVSSLTPVFLIFGVFLFKKSNVKSRRDSGRILVGLGLVFLSLHILLDTLAPAESAPEVRAAFMRLQDETLLLLIIGTITAWISHSSVATIVLISSLAFSNFINTESALILVLGANLGSALNPLFESGDWKNPASKRLQVGNLFNRTTGIIGVLLFKGTIVDFLATLNTNPVQQVAYMHLLFNIVTTLVFLIPVRKIATSLESNLKQVESQANEGLPLYLDNAALETPSLAISLATREVLRIADYVEQMLKDSLRVIRDNRRELAGEISRRDNIVDQLYSAIKLFMVRLTSFPLDESEGQRVMEILSYTINLEHIGDIIDKNLTSLASRKFKRGVQFSPEGSADLEKLHRLVLQNFRLAISCFISNQGKNTGELIDKQSELNELEIVATEQHFMRLKEGMSISIESSALHLDVIRDLRRINSHIQSALYSMRTVESCKLLPEESDIEMHQGIFRGLIKPSLKQSQDI